MYFLTPRFFSLSVLPMLGLLLFSACGRLAADNSPTPVFIGGDAYMDACGGYGKVAGLKPNPGNFLALRNQPGTHGLMVDKLKNDQPLWLCAEEGDWIGVVVPDEGVDCELSKPVAEHRAYQGPCRSGWVYAKYVELLAG